MVWIKICGITSRADAGSVSGMGTDSLGFIFSTDSPRKISLEQAIEVVKGSGNAAKTGVFVNEKINKIVKYKDTLGLDFVQLSGDEDIRYINDLKNSLAGTSILKTFRIGKDSLEDLKKQIMAFLEYADYIIFDSYHKNKYGGTGKAIKWENIKGLADPERLIISGGLDHKNVGRAIKVLDPFGVDVSSRLEVSPGKKDLNKVKLFITAARGSDKQDKGNGNV